MRSFVDNLGRTWTLLINVGAVKRVRALCDGLDLLNIIAFDTDSELPDTSVLDKLASDPILLVDVLYAVCKPEADTMSVSDEDFGRALTGDVIESATKQLIDAVVDFFPEAKRKVCQRIISAANRFADEQRKTICAMLDDPELDKALNSQFEMLKNTSTPVQGSAE